MKKLMALGILLVSSLSAMENSEHNNIVNSLPKDSLVRTICSNSNKALFWKWHCGEIAALFNCINNTNPLCSDYNRPEVFGEHLQSHVEAICKHTKASPEITLQEVRTVAQCAIAKK